VPRSSPKGQHPIERCKVFDLVTEPGQAPRARVTCSNADCTQTSDHSLTQVGTPPHVIAQWFRREGWNIRGEGKKAECPDCQIKKRDAKKERRANREPEQTAPQPPKETPAVSASAKQDPPVPQTRDTFRQQRKLFGLLEEHFDSDQHCYLRGYSDERLSQDTGLSLTYVRQAREEAFGKLIDPELSRLNDKIAATRKKHAGELDDLARAIAETKERQENELAALQDEVKRKMEGRRA